MLDKTVSSLNSTSNKSPPLIPLTTTHLSIPKIINGGPKDATAKTPTCSLWTHNAGSMSEFMTGQHP